MRKKKGASNNEYNMHVKQQLAHWRKEYEKNHQKLNFTQIAKDMQENFGIDTSTQKISAMFDPENPREVKLPEITALAQKFNIPLWDLVQHPNTYDEGLNSYSSGSGESSAIHSLNNERYMTKDEKYYYCYYFHPKHSHTSLKPIANSDIMEARMSITSKNGHTVIDFEELTTHSSFYGKSLDPFTLTGNLYHLKNSEMAYSFIADKTGSRAMALLFSYLNLRADILYYITMGMLTLSLNQTHEPLFQKMAVFRQRQNLEDEKNKDIIKGILALNSTSLILDEDTLITLKNSNPALNKLLPGEKSPHKVYILNESEIIDSFSVSDDYEKMSSLLLVKSKSLFPAHEVVSETDTFIDFIKKYQIRQRLDSQTDISPGNEENNR